MTPRPDLPLTLGCLVLAASLFGWLTAAPMPRWRAVACDDWYGAMVARAGGE